MTEHYEAFICTDCAMLAANGDVGDRGPIGCLTEYQQNADDAHLYELPGDDQWNNATTRHAARMSAWLGGGSLTLGDSDKDREFSSSSCDGCGSSLAGYRFHAAYWSTDDKAGA